MGDTQSAVKGNMAAESEVVTTCCCYR